jgi:hypothetical protein
MYLSSDIYKLCVGILVSFKSLFCVPIRSVSEKYSSKVISCHFLQWGMRNILNHNVKATVTPATT